MQNMRYHHRRRYAAGFILARSVQPMEVFAVVCEEAERTHSMLSKELCGGIQMN